MKIPWKPWHENKKTESPFVPLSHACILPFFLLLENGVENAKEKTDIVPFQTMEIGLKTQLEKNNSVCGYVCFGLLVLSWVFALSLTRATILRIMTPRELFTMDAGQKKKRNKIWSDKICNKSSTFFNYRKA